MTVMRTKNSKYALGISLIACLLLGGGTARVLVIDVVLQVLVIISSTYAIILLDHSRSKQKYGIILFCGIVFAGAIQLLPLPLELFFAFRNEAFIPFIRGLVLPVDTTTISLAASRSVQSIIFVLVPVYFFIALNKLPPKELSELIPFYIIGLICNLVAAGIQYSFASGYQLNYLLGYQVMVGMFANVNHFATILFSSIPIVLYLMIFMNRRALAVLILLLIIVMLFATGSRAGILIGLAITAVSIIMLVWPGPISSFIVLLLIVGLIAYGFGISTVQDYDPEYGRRYFAIITWAAIKENWFLGIGYGAFDMIFSHYEVRDAINASYVNHAHNDFLEVTLEGGIIGLSLIFLYIGMFSRQSYLVIGNPLQKLAMLSIIVILIHSIVDYPLRTMAVAMVFAFLNALLFSSYEHNKVRSGALDTVAKI